MTRTFLVLLTLTLGACDPSARAADTTDAGPPDAGEPASCGWDGEPACTTCLDGACCAQTTACAADPDCWACVRGDDGTRCEASVETHAHVDALLTCQSTACHAECFGAPAPECTWTFEGDCSACLETSCCEPVANCAAYDACIDCVSGNHDACHAAAASHAAAHALFACAAERCSPVCDG